MSSDTSDATGRTKVSLKRHFRILHSMSFISSFVVGMGIFVGPTGVMRRVISPGLVLIIWALVGCLSICEGVVYAEYATTFQNCGGCSFYIDVFYGKTVGYFQVWVYFFRRTGADAIKCLLAATYVTVYLLPDCHDYDTAIRIIAVALMCLLIYSNMMSVRLSGKFQATCAFISVSSLLLIIVCGCIRIAQGDVEHLHGMFDSMADESVGDVALATYSVLYAYAGGTILSFMVEEITNPEKTVPRATIAVKSFVIVLFVLVNMSFIAVLGPQGIRDTPAVALTFAEQTIGRASGLIALVVSTTCVGNLMAGLLLTSRLGFAAARRGHLPSVLGLLNLNSYAPVMALILEFLVFIPLIIIGDIYSILNNVAFLDCLTEVLVSYGYIRHRIQYPAVHRPFKLHLSVHVVYAVLSTVLLFVPMVTKPRESALGFVAVMLLTTPYYVLFIKGLAPTGFMQGINRRITIVAQKLFFAAPQDVDILDQLGWKDT